MSFVSLQTALTAMRAAQTGLDTTANNVANANTPGYTRQRVNLASRPSFMSPVGPIGTGVMVTDIQRLRDEFLDTRMRLSNADLGRATTLGEMARRVEDVVAEPDFGLSVELADLWASFEDLATQPADGATRRQVLNSLESLAVRVNNLAHGLDAVYQDGVTQFRTGVEEVNTILGRLSEVNRSITNNVGTGDPNDLFDERDRLLDDLAARIGAAGHIEENGGATVTLQGMILLSGTRVSELTPPSAAGAGFEPGQALEVMHPSGTPVPIRSGELGGLHASLTESIPDRMQQLDGFALELASRLNDQHALGFTPAGDEGGALFEFTGIDIDDPGFDPDALPVGALIRNLRVAITQTSDLAAAGTAPTEDPDNPGTFLPYDATFDGNNAGALAGLRSGIDTEWRGIVTDIGVETATALRRARGEAGINVAAQAARENAHGVSLDEEMVALITFQRAFESAARVTTAVDEVLATLINRTGIVGR